MRLTIKGTALIDCGGTIANLGKEEYSRRYHEKSVLAHSKLEKLEDIEEKLGIDLPTLFKAFDGIWYKSKNGGMKFSCHVALTDTVWELRPLEECLESGNTNDMSETLALKDYGKTWALTKEELREEEQWE